MTAREQKNLFMSFYDKLTNEAKEAVATTEMRIFTDVFGGITTPEELNEFCKPGQIVEGRE